VVKAAHTIRTRWRGGRAARQEKRLGTLAAATELGQIDIATEVANVAPQIATLLGREFLAEALFAWLARLRLLFGVTAGEVAAGTAFVVAPAVSRRCEDKGNEDARQ
jgi:hypothetical protein